MTASQMLPAIGATVLVKFEQLTIQATVANVKNTYGRTRLLIKPTGGSGQQWVELQRLIRPEDSELGGLIVFDKDFKL